MTVQILLTNHVKLRPSERAFNATLLTVMAALFVGSVGCGPNIPTAQLSGTITCEGEPLEEALLVISNPDLGVYITAQIADGDFEIKTADQGVPPGDYRIAITPPIVDHPVGPIRERPQDIEYPMIPARYRDEATSGLTVQLQAGENTYDVDLEKRKN